MIIFLFSKVKFFILFSNGLSQIKFHLGWLPETLFRFYCLWPEDSNLVQQGWKPKRCFCAVLSLFTKVEIKWDWDWQFRKYLLLSNNKWYNYDQLHRLTTIRFNALKTDIQQHDTTDRLTRIQFGQHSTSSSTCEKSSLCELFSLAGKQVQMNLNRSQYCLKG